MSTMTTTTTTTSILDLPSHVLVQIASHLNTLTLKSLAEVHSYLTPAAETHLYRRLTLPISNPHHSVSRQSPHPSADSDSNTLMGRGCTYDLKTTWVPSKPSLSRRLAEHGWKEDYHRSNHLDASMRLINESLTSKSVSDSDRTTYPRELVIDLKKRYHDVDLDLDTISLPAITTTTVSRPNQAMAVITQDAQAVFVQTQTQIQIQPQTQEMTSGEGLGGDYKETSTEPEWDVSPSTLLHLSQLRQIESPAYDPHLRHTFDHFPILPSVKRVEARIYESYQGYLLYLLCLTPNLSELALRPDTLLAESSLIFPPLDIQWPGSLKTLRIEGMIDTLQPIVVDLLHQCEIRSIVLTDSDPDSDRGRRGGWAIIPELVHALLSCPTLERIEVGKAAREVLQSAREWPEGVLVDY